MLDLKNVTGVGQIFGRKFRNHLWVLTSVRRKRLEHLRVFSVEIEKCIHFLRFKLVERVPEIPQNMHHPARLFPREKRDDVFDVLGLALLGDQFRTP